MIQIKDVSYCYQTEKVLKDIELSIDKGEKITIIGKSGCGKTTLLYLLAGILKPTKGNISIDQEDLTEYREGTSLIFQKGGLFPWKTVKQNLELGLKVRKVPKLERDVQIQKILKELGIESYENRYIKELSGGQMQRVAIARSLVLNSDLLLLDEPSSALDAMTKDKFQNTLLELYQHHQLTSILVTHDIFEAVYLGQKIIVMSDGKIEKIIDNHLYGKEDAKKTIEFYQTCIEIKELLELC